MALGILLTGSNASYAALARGATSATPAVPPDSTNADTAPAAPAAGTSEQSAKQRRRGKVGATIPAPPAAQPLADAAKARDGWQPREPDYDRLGPLITKIGQDIVDELGEVPSRAFLVVHIAEKWADARLFIDRGKVVQFIAPNGEVPKTVMKLWKVDNAGQPKPLRWVYLEYDITRKKMKARFVFPEEIAQGSGMDEWTQAGLRKRFRKKPVVAEDVPLADDAPRT